MSDEARRARAEARRGRLVIRHTTLAAQDACPEGSPKERVELAFALTRAAWAMTGMPWPEPGSGRTRVRFVPRGET